uniref:Uncharacterized protein n=1 Tax=Helicotheca tamesis TaxID=374047 RepID=A0A7S2MPZ7_9STRA|eukprot:CAMPEP_0185732710 /NCGR_PEP_ID=MMETSP1171-20130828/17288_1 /TAXON_ID=374046 /ORGANISM="Helicotheca tamensis, Strain CCMP826" /LENGTH=299 /DNA_ID=CAMNT_0028402277 /DNA_START=37 /DNA_END=936 /DNA_ORIENTATION=-
MAPSAPNTAPLLAAAAGSAILLAYASMKMFSSKADLAKTDIGDIDEEALEGASSEEFITPDDVCKVFDTLFMQMQNVVAQLSQQIQQLQMAGQKIPEDKLHAMLKTEYEHVLTMIQQKVFDENDVDEDCLQEATWEFMADPEKYPKVIKSVERFQKLYERISGEKVVGKRPGDGATATEKSVGTVVKKSEEISPEKLLEAAQVFFEAITESMGDLVKKYKAEGKNLQDMSVAQSLQLQFASMADEVGGAALKKMDMTLEDFHGAIEKHKSRPEIGQTLMMLQIKQQQQLIALGMPAPMG